MHIVNFMRESFKYFQKKFIFDCSKKPATLNDLQREIVACIVILSNQRSNKALKTSFNSTFFIVI